MQTWTFGPAGIYTATWDGVSKVTVTLTAGGAFVASFFAQSLTAAVASPEYQAILSPAPSAVTGLQLMATTGLAGFALQNATPTIQSWTAPNDGNLHRAQIFAVQHVVSTETGGGVQVVYTLPDGTVAAPHTALAGGAAAGDGILQNNLCILVQAGTTVTVKQASALTAGAAVVWAEIWAS